MDRKTSYQSRLFSLHRVTHSTQAIIKPVPQNKSNEAAQKEIEEEVNRVKEAQQSLLPPVVLAEEIQGKYGFVF